MALIGTAGHVDHGKSTLVEALTGINPMHLPEEHRRELTIELGFAHLRHPAGYTLSFVDVPGHEKLVRTMISGAMAFQLALWVVDAREGLMPQSLEHLDVLQLLGVPRILPVITKADLATEQQIRETRQAIEARLPQSLRIAVVDSVSRRGIEQLKETLFEACSEQHGSPDDGPYLPVDRSFVLQGVGVVVTGTLVRGRLKEGDSVMTTPSGAVFRIRSLHNHKTTVGAIGPGNRVGVQLHGVHAGQLQRGECLVAPQYPYRSRSINATLDLLPNTQFRFKHGVRVLFLTAAVEVECRLWGLVEAEGKTWVQIHLPHELPFFPSQRFILRSTNPLTTIGGGTVMDIAPDAARRVSDAERTPSRYFELAKPEIFSLDLLCRKWMCAPEAFDAPGLAKWKGLAWSEKLTALAREKLIHRVADARSREAEWPFQGIAAQLRISRSRVGPFLEFLLPQLKAAVPGALSLTSSTLRFDPNRGGLSGEERRVADLLAEQIAAAGLQPLRATDYADVVKAERKMFDKALSHLLRDRVLLRIDLEFVVDRQVWEQFVGRIRNEMQQPLTVSEFGKQFGLSRKYSVPYLESLNRMGITKRVGDKHAVNLRG